jgi:hypothetical protein
VVALDESLADDAGTDDAERVIVAALSWRNPSLI